jgi:hypothetical protein
MTCVVKTSFKTGLEISLEITHVDPHISFDKNWFSRFKFETLYFKFELWSVRSCRSPSLYAGGALFNAQDPRYPSDISIKNEHSGHSKKIRANDQ